MGKGNEERRDLTRINPECTWWCVIDEERKRQVGQHDILKHEKDMKGNEERRGERTRTNDL